MSRNQLIAYVLLGLFFTGIMGFGWGIFVFIFAVFLHWNIDQVGK